MIGFNLLMRPHVTNRSLRLKFRSGSYNPCVSGTKKPGLKSKFQDRVCHGERFRRKFILLLILCVNDFFLKKYNSSGKKINSSFPGYS